MILYVNGDSHSAGAELGDASKAWPQLLANRLGCSLVNEAKIGASNSRIIRTASNALTHINGKEALVVIGWTSWEREEWYHQGQYYDVNSAGHDAMPVDLQEKYKEWVLKQSPEEQSRKSKITHEQLHKFHRSLNEKHVPHLFFNAVMPFQHNLLDPVHKDWNKNYLGPYNNDLSYFWYLKNHGYTPTATYHYLDDAQSIWADVLYNYIQENKLL